MRNRLTSPLLLGLSLTAGGLMACGDSSGSDSMATLTDGDSDTESGDGDGDPGDGDPGDGDGDPTGDGDGDGDPTGDGDGDPTGDGDGDPGCMAWEITYDLDGSVFEISATPFGAGDQVNTVVTPDTEDDTLGPGTFVLRFNDVAGEPGGNAFMVSYSMTMEFVVATQGATVETTLQNDAGPEDCGITTAALQGSTADWNPLQIVGHHSVGQLLCTGNLCGFANFTSGVPEPVDEITNHPLEPFTFSGDFTSFDMPTVQVQMDQNSTTEWTFVGTETSRELVPAPDCMCQ